MPVPEAVAVPWLACVATATEVAAPPDTLRVTALAVLFAATVVLEAFATGATAASLHDTIAVTVPAEFTLP